ncbi:MAG: hypothetical protein PUI29_01290 [Aeromonadales bacterium]|nr:hypothetical protein [Aeromonadales bacterium]
MSLPLKMMLPLLMGTRPIRHLSSVVLPTPLRPMMQVHSPCCALSVTPFRMWLSS